MENLIYELVVMALLLQYPSWRIFKRAGLNPIFSVFILVPGLGLLIFGLILAVANWKVQPLKGN